MRLSDREWTVLTALWDLGPAELGAVTAHLHHKTKWSRNTVLTYLSRMEAKGLVGIDKNISPHLYHAVIGREECRKQERRSFLDRVYSGCAGDLIAAFLREEPISREELERLKQLLDDMEV